MRAISVQVCGVCRLQLTSKAEMDTHTREMHGVNWAPAMLCRAGDQSEFVPCSAQTPWGSEFR